MHYPTVLQVQTHLVAPLQLPETPTVQMTLPNFWISLWHLCHIHSQRLSGELLSRSQWRSLVESAWKLIGCKDGPREVSNYLSLKYGPNRGTRIFFRLVSKKQCIEGIYKLPRVSEKQEAYIKVLSVQF